MRVDGALREKYDLAEVEACRQARTRRVVRSVVAAPVVVLGLLVAVALARRRHDDLTGVRPAPQWRDREHAGEDARWTLCQT